MMRDVYFTWGGMGDSLLLLGAAHNYFRKRNQKLLIATDWPQLSALAPFVEILEGFGFNKFNLNPNELAIRRLKAQGYNPIFLTANSYCYLAPDYKYNVQRWPSSHIITRLCERMGLNGAVEISIPLDLESESVQGNEFPNKDFVCVMVGGLQKYKALDPKVVQGIVDHLKQRFTIIQIGSAFDKKLNSVVDLRGLNILKVIGLLKKAAFFIGGTGGLVHLAKAAGCNSFVLQTTGEPLSMSFYANNGYIFPVHYCDICSKNFRDPQHQQCFYNYICMNFCLDPVIDALDSYIESMGGDKKLFTQIEFARANPATGIEDFWLKQDSLYCASSRY